MSAKKNLTISIQLFGAFRRAHPYPVKLHLANDTTIGDIKKALGAALQELNPDFKEAELINRSVLADSCKIYTAEHVISESISLSILPPVCGG